MNTNRRRLVLAALASGWGSASAQATNPPPEVAAEVPGARLAGGGKLRFMGLQVYDARLWTAAGSLPADWSSAPFALELRYARTLQGKLISERSLKEMRRQGEIADEQAERWLAQLMTVIPDVQAGDRITGVNRPGQAARFHFNGQLRGEVQEAEFARVFFGIWLSPQTSEPSLRKALLGGSA